MSGNFAEAVTDMRRAASEAVDVRMRVITADEYHYETGLVYFHNGDWSKGREEMRWVGEEGPFGVQALSRRELVGYTVQLGAYRVEERARREAERLNATVRMASGKALLFFVSSGPYARLEDAREQAEHFRLRGCPDAFVLP